MKWPWSNPPVKKPLRDAANVIADAVTAAKDTKIKEAENKLEEANDNAVEQRKQLNAILRAGRLLHREIIKAGDAFENTIDGAWKDRKDD